MLQSPTFKVWFDWGENDRDSVTCHEFGTLLELNAFINGVQAAAEGFGLDDYAQFDSEKELDEFFAEQEA